MSIHTHIDSLSEKRSQIKAQIAQETHRPSPDFALITTLKKQNLLLKEEMQRYFKLMKQSAAATS